MGYRRKSARLGRAAPDATPNEDEPGFCKSVTLEEIAKHGHALTPGRHVAAAVVEDDGEPFEDKMQRLVAQLHEHQVEGAKLDTVLGNNLELLGFGGQRKWWMSEILLTSWIAIPTTCLWQ